MNKATIAGLKVLAWLIFSAFVLWGSWHANLLYFKFMLRYAGK